MNAPGGRAGVGTLTHQASKTQTAWPRPARREKEEAAAEEEEEEEEEEEKGGSEGRMAGRKEWLLGYSGRSDDCPSHQWKRETMRRNSGSEKKLCNKNYKDGQL